MPGRTIPPESKFHDKFYGSEYAQRRSILRDTIRAFTDAKPPDRYHVLAMNNLKRWREERNEPHLASNIIVLPGDWGEVTLAMTKKYGACFAVLNMANAYVPGGSYVEGTIAQEENMFRRTDCHFSITEDVYDVGKDRYRPEVTRLLSAKDGRVYLDKEHPRVCIRGPEIRAEKNLGYPWLPDDQVFPFFELRAAAQDLRDGSPFNAEEMRRRIAAQFATLRMNDVKHTVLSAFGCGAFHNPNREVARIYREEIDKCKDDFLVIAFAIFAPGYGPDNYTPFAKVFAQ